MASRWVCPHCDHASVITDASITTQVLDCRLDSADGNLAVMHTFIACPNPRCKRVTFTMRYGRGYKPSSGHVEWTTTAGVKTLRLLPPSYARPIPDYVPFPIRQDYEEACAIADLSPKAAAALSRRALQGIVRDFHGVTGPTLYKELEALKPLVDPVVWKAIDAVRGIGNIGAHMEKDINVIVDVEPEEAVRLIRLIEMLIREWYIARKNREDELAAIIAIGDKKQEERKAISAEPEAKASATVTAATKETHPPTV